MSVLNDQHGRTFSYLRLSLTDACNFRCQYCLPRGYQRSVESSNGEENTPLSLAEIENLVAGFSDLGVTKVRLTGGEPTLRRDIVEIVSCVSRVPGISTVALTTNGYRLKTLLTPLIEAGLSAVNISVDSLDARRFAEVTGSRCFGRVLDGLESVLASGIKRVKINVVLLKSSYREELASYMKLLRESPVTVRFIELMETGDNRDYFNQEYLAGVSLREILEEDGWVATTRSATDGPAIEYRHTAYRGRVGLISPYSPDFCAGCNRLRVSSRGELKLCLFGEGVISLRDYLQCPEQRPLLVARVRELVRQKPAAHRLHEGIFGSTAHLASIGG